ncbi:MAG: cytidine deaminase [Armatimonadetes bacterium]|nr:cytidine deaminase [Armatimonadota bacterium]
MVDPSDVEEMCRLARENRYRAYAPYSDYGVGAAVLGKSNKIYTGFNIENGAYGSSMCAERVAIFKAISEGEEGIKAIVICADGEEPPHPCGACLQVMSEFDVEELSMLIVLVNNREIEAHALEDYLPMPFKLEV